VRRRSLRLRLTLAVGFGVAFLSVLFASVAYFGVRHILVVDRQTTDLRQAYVNAALVRNAVNSGSPALHELIKSLDTATSSTSVVHVNRTWFARTLKNPQTVIPRGIQFAALNDQVARQVVVTKGVPILYIDVPIPAAQALYFQLDNLTDLDSTLRSLMLIFAASALFTTSIGVLGGRRIIRRSMAPLEVASQAATKVANGALDTRIPLDPRNDEVSALAHSFNTMVEQLVVRLQRDARFAGDVSHELRSPLTTLATSVEVMRRSREELTPEGRAAFDLLATDVGIFQVLVEDLLEIARSDGGASTMHLEEVQLTRLLEECVISAERRHQLTRVSIVAKPDARDVLVQVDRRRFDRVITNLLDNATRYGGGAVAIRVSRVDGRVAVDVDDAGPGVIPAERERVFDRFYRGSMANDRGAARGTGLGLSLVADHVKHFGGDVSIRMSPEGGARFRITLPVLDEGVP
jgi:two-component system, OmpR family, sensor histidine kinase MtrB